MARKRLTPEAQSLIFKPESIIDRIDPAGLFPSDQPLEVELGSGDGSFIVQYAQECPDRNCIAIERLLGRFHKIVRKAARAGLSNLRAVRLEASYFVEYMLPHESVSALHIYFPDPWPKRKHRRKRLVNEHFTKVARQVLKPEGVVYLRTDDSDYFEQMTDVFGAGSAFAPVETPASLAQAVTDFERDFNARGIKTRHAAYRRMV